MVHRNWIGYWISAILLANQLSARFENAHQQPNICKIVSSISDLLSASVDVCWLLVIGILAKFHTGAVLALLTVTTGPGCTCSTIPRNLDTLTRYALPFLQPGS